jgi:hypothetical protein
MLSASTAGDVKQILLTALSNAATLGVAADKLFAIMDALDSAATAAKVPSVSGAGRRLAEPDDLTGFLDSYGQILAKDLVVGDGGIDLIQTNFRMATHIVTSDEGYISLPRSLTEISMGVQSSHVQLLGLESGASSASLVLSSQATSLFAHSGIDYTANPLRLLLSNQSAISSVVMVLQTNGAQDYVYYPGNGTVNTTCIDGDNFNYTKTCYLPGNKGVVEIAHRCSGVSEMLSTPCPGIKILPKCAIIEGVDFECSVVTYSSTSTTCNCSLRMDSTGRRLSIAEESGAIQIATAAEYVVDEFAGTLSTAGEFNSVNDLSKVIIVIVLYGALWGVGAMAILGFTLRSAKRTHANKKKREEENQAKMLSHDAHILDPATASSAVSRSSTSEVAAKLIKYVDSVFPAVYQGRWWGARMSDELFNHHRYMLLFRKPKESTGERTRVVTALQLLSVQSMLMFILAVLYDLQVIIDVVNEVVIFTC